MNETKESLMEPNSDQLSAIFGWNHFLTNTSSIRIQISHYCYNSISLVGSYMMVLGSYLLLPIFFFCYSRYILGWGASDSLPMTILSSILTNQLIKLYTIISHKHNRITCSFIIRFDDTIYTDFTEFSEKRVL